MKIEKSLIFPRDGSHIETTELRSAELLLAPELHKILLIAALWYLNLIIVRTSELVQSILNQIMRRATGWLDELGLELANQKTEIVVLTRKRIDTLFPMTMLGEDIMTKEAVKYLGITLDTKLTSSHILRLPLTKQRAWRLC